MIPLEIADGKLLTDFLMDFNENGLKSCVAYV